MLRLVGGDTFPVWPLELTAKELRVRTPWADELRVPRGAVESLGQWPGRQVAGLAGETGSLALPTPVGARALGALQGASPSLQRALRGALMVGSLALLGHAGSSVSRDLTTRAVGELDVPLWFDEAKLLGLALLIAHLAWRVAETPDDP